MAENLYNLVQSQMKSDSGKTKLGYTVTQYASVLGALQQSKFIIKKIVQQGGGSSGTAGTFDSSSGLSFGAQYSTYGQQKFSIKMQSGTFWTDQKQGLCKVNSYMSFPVQMDNSTYHVPYEKPFQQFQYGNTLCGKSTFPPTLMEFVTNTSYTADYIIGIGLDFQRFVLPYFEHFYGAESGWKDKNDIIRNIAKERKLHAEILFPHGSTSVNDKEGASGSFFVIHVPVVIDYNSENDSFFVMYFPAPLLLLNSFNQGGKLGSVQVKLGEKTCKVGQTATFPFSGKHYNHTSGTITGYNQQAYKALKTNDGGVSATQITVSFPKGVNTDCFIRLFFDKSVESQLGLSIADEALKQQLFKSAYNPSDLIKREIIQGGGFNMNFSAGDIELLKAISDKLTDKSMTPEKILLALEAVAQFESGRKWDKCGDIGDGQGFSCGGLQFTVAAGGVKVFCKCYQQVAKTKNFPITQSQQSLIDYGISNGRVKSKSTFVEMLGNEIGKTAQYATWIEEKGSITVSMYNKICNGEQGCPLLFAAVVGSVNHMPGLYPKYINEAINATAISSAPDLQPMQLKIIHAEGAHWSAWADFKKNVNRKQYYWNGEIPSSTELFTARGSQILTCPTKYGLGQWRRYASNCNAALNKNYNLTELPTRNQKPSGWKS